MAPQDALSGTYLEVGTMDELSDDARRRRSFLGLAAAAVPLTAAVVTGGGATAAFADSRSSTSSGTAGRSGAGGRVGVLADTQGVTLSTGTVPAGLVPFEVSTAETAQQAVGLLRLTDGVQLADYLAHYVQAATAASAADRAAGVALIDAEAFYFGGAAVLAGSGRGTVTVTLPPGEYVLVNYSAVALPGFAAGVRLLRVVPARGPYGRPPQADDIAAQYDQGTQGLFLVSARLAARGSLQVTNHSSQLNELMIVPVVPGTTAAQVTAFCDAVAAGQYPSSSPLAGTPVGLTPLSPGATAYYSYSLPAGPYLVTSFISDRRTGVKEMFENMWALTELR